MRNIAYLTTIPSLHSLLLSYENATCSPLTTHAKVSRRSNNFCIAARWIWMSGGAKREREKGQLVRERISHSFRQLPFLRRYFFRGSLSRRKGNLADERAPNLPRADAVFAPHRHPCCLVNLYNTASCLLFPLPKHRLHTIITTPWDYFVFLAAKQCREGVGEMGENLWMR